MNIEMWTLICLILISAVLLVFLAGFLVLFFRLLNLEKETRKILEKVNSDLSFVRGLSGGISKISRKVSPLFSVATSVFYIALSVKEKMLRRRSK